MSKPALSRKDRGVERVAETATSLGRKLARSGKSKKKARNLKRRPNRGTGRPAFTTQVRSIPLAESVVTRTGVRHGRTGLQKEPVQDLASSPTAGLFSKIFEEAINPANSQLFPQETSEATNWESYRFKRLEMWVVNSANFTISGDVAMMVDYDPVDAAPTNMYGVLTSAGAVEFLPAQTTKLRVNIDNTWRYVVETVSNAGSALDRQQDLGVFRVFGDKMAANTSIGRLVVVYDIEYKNRRPPQALAFSSPIANLVANNPGADMVFAQDGSYVRGWTWTLAYQGRDDQGTFTDGLYLQPNGNATGVFELYVANLTVAVGNCVVNLIATSGAGTASIATWTVSAAVYTGLALTTNPLVLDGTKRYYFNVVPAVGATWTATGANAFFSASSPSPMLGRRHALRLRSGPDSMVFGLPAGLSACMSYLANFSGTVLCAPAPEPPVSEEEERFRRWMSRLDEEKTWQL